MNWSQWFVTFVLLCLHCGPVLAKYDRQLFCERLRLSVVNFVGDDFDVYNKLLFEHSVFIYKKLCLHQKNVSQSFLLDDIMEDENDDVTTPWGAMAVNGEPADILNHDRNLWFENLEKQQPHWFEKEL